MEQTVLKDIPVVLMFLKAPRAGFVKTRLASGIGDAAAAEVYRRLVRCQMAEIPAEWELEIHYTPVDASREVLELVGSSRCYTAFPQSEGDLGSRLAEAFKAASVRHPGKPLFAIGGDCPDLTESHLNEAARCLSKSDLVIGPACDGGYYLIGMHAPNPVLFEGICWSTASVFQETRKRAERAGLDCQCLPMLEDVDDLPSLKRVRPEFLKKRPIPIEPHA